MWVYFLSLMLIFSASGLVIPGQETLSLSNATVAEPDPMCPMVGLDCIFHDIERAYDSATWQECASQCAQNRLCAFWSWRTPAASVNPYGCWLKSDCPFTISDTALISGAYSCTS